MTAPASAKQASGSAIYALAFSIVAFLFATIGLVVVAADDGGGSATSSEAGPIAVSLTDYAITPATINAAAGDVSLAVSNDAGQVHNLAIADLNAKTADLSGGASADLELKDVAPGTYAVICTIPGHEALGMVATLIVTEGGASTEVAAGGDTTMTGMDHDNPSPEVAAAMDERMQKGMTEGLATFTGGGGTEGIGNVKLEPTTVEADGTKVFDLEASIIDWEVSPGKIVKAWAYNGMVPAPWIRTEPNDKVKVNIENNLPIDTDIHWHGISTPFPMDGVAYLTQELPVNPGETFTYEWTNPDRPELGMYHPHTHGQTAVINGMFGVFQVGDMPLPRGETISGRDIPADLTVTQEVPMVLNDAGTIGFSLNGKSYPATSPISADLGDNVLVTYYNEGLTAHPMHLHRLPQLVVARDGIALEQPYWADTINVAPGERFTVLIMPREAGDVGVWAYHCHILTHAENDDGLFGMVTAMIVSDPNAPAA